MAKGTSARGRARIKPVPDGPIVPVSLIRPPLTAVARPLITVLLTAHLALGCAYALFVPAGRDLLSAQGVWAFAAGWVLLAIFLVTGSFLGLGVLRALAPGQKHIPRTHVTRVAAADCVASASGASAVAFFAGIASGDVMRILAMVSVNTLLFTWPVMFPEMLARFNAESGTGVPSEAPVATN